MMISMQKANSPADLAYPRWATAIAGNPLDQRGRSAVQFLREKADQTIEILYDPDQFAVTADGDTYEVEDLPDFFAGKVRPSVVLETTTLGFAEILICCKALRSSCKGDVDFLYVEPGVYRSPKRRHLLHRRDFELSEEVPGYRAIPGATILLDDRRPHKGVFLLGYEERRLARAFEDFPMLRPSQSAVVFGVPAFKAGWEMDAFANNVNVIRDQNVEGGVHFCGAANPAGAYEILREIYDSLEASERLFVAPIGTKPLGLSSALFAAEYPDVGVLYDHPRRRPDRSRNTGAWHLYRAGF